MLGLMSFQMLSLNDVIWNLITWLPLSTHVTTYCCVKKRDSFIQYGSIICKTQGTSTIWDLLLRVLQWPPRRSLNSSLFLHLLFLHQTNQRPLLWGQTTTKDCRCFWQSSEHGIINEIDTTMLRQCWSPVYHIFFHDVKHRTWLPPRIWLHFHNLPGMCARVAPQNASCIVDVLKF
jgi:hypothetical protein